MLYAVMTSKICSHAHAVSSKHTPPDNLGDTSRPKCGMRLDISWQMYLIVLKELLEEVVVFLFHAYSPHHCE